MEVQPVTEGELQDLGRERAKAIKQELVTKGKIAEGRLIVLEPSKAEEKSEEAVASTLNLDVAR
jgi:outer membrane protein OmpA-like peptidoglycan-associated protein